MFTYIHQSAEIYEKRKMRMFTLVNESDKEALDSRRNTNSGPDSRHSEQNIQSYCLVFANIQTLLRYLRK